MKLPIYKKSASFDVQIWQVPRLENCCRDIIFWKSNRSHSPSVISFSSSSSSSSFSPLHLCTYDEFSLTVGLLVFRETQFARGSDDRPAINFNSAGPCGPLCNLPLAGVTTSVSWGENHLFLRLIYPLLRDRSIDRFIQVCRASRVHYLFPSPSTLPHLRY